MFNTFDEFNILVEHMTDWEMIEWVTDLYVSRLEPIDYDAVEKEDDRCDKQSMIEKVYCDW